MDNLVHFHGLHRRAYLIVPSGKPGDDCLVIRSGEAVDSDLLRYSGPVEFLKRLLRERGRGVPVIVSPACYERRAGQ
jgi:hypothetical protein